MLRAIRVVPMTLMPFVLPWQAAQAQQSEISSLYVAASNAPASLVGRYSNRDKCIEAASAASSDIITINSANVQFAAVLLCISSRSEQVAGMLEVSKPETRRRGPSSIAKEQKKSRSERRAGPQS